MLFDTGHCCREGDHALLGLTTSNIIPSDAVTDGSVAAYSLVGTASIERIVKKPTHPSAFAKSEWSGWRWTPC